LNPWTDLPLPADHGLRHFLLLPFSDLSWVQPQALQQRPLTSWARDGAFRRLCPGGHDPRPTGTCSPCPDPSSLAGCSLAAQRGLGVRQTRSAGVSQPAGAVAALVARRQAGSGCAFGLQLPHRVSGVLPAAARTVKAIGDGRDSQRKTLLRPMSRCVSSKLIAPARTMGRSCLGAVPADHRMPKPASSRSQLTFAGCPGHRDRHPSSGDGAGDGRAPALAVSFRAPKPSPAHRQRRPPAPLALDTEAANRFHDPAVSSASPTGVTLPAACGACAALCAITNPTARAMRGFGPDHQVRPPVAGLDILGRNNRKPTCCASPMTSAWNCAADSAANPTAAAAGAAAGLDGWTAAHPGPQHRQTSTPTRLRGYDSPLPANPKKALAAFAQTQVAAPALGTFCSLRKAERQHGCKAGSNENA